MSTCILNRTSKEKSVHRLLEQFELIHVELLLLLACSLGSHAPARLVALTVFIFNCQVFDE
jgi:hypothetical protein